MILKIKEELGGHNKILHLNPEKETYIFGHLVGHIAIMVLLLLMK